MMGAVSMVISVIMMIMVMLMIVVMIMIVIMVMVMIVIMMMVVIMMLMPVVMPLFKVPVQICHVVIMPVVLFIEDHIEVAAVYARFLHSADLRLESVSGNPIQDFQKLLLIRPKVKQRGYSHVAADSSPAFQIKDLITVLHPIYYLHRPGG